MRSVDEDPLEVHNGNFSRQLAAGTAQALDSADGAEDLGGGKGSGGRKDIQHLMDPGYAAGKILLTDIADNLLSQAFFNVHVLPLLSASSTRR